jgi:RND family efflux transporter MFP subunit
MPDEVNMNRNAFSPSRKRALMIAILLIVATAGAIGFWFLGWSDRGSLVGRPVPTPDFDLSPSSTNGAAARPGDLLITVQPERLENAHFKIETAVRQLTASDAVSGLRTTGVIEPNAYKTAPVLSIAGGLVKEVSFELGDRVGRGQKLATIFSAELADAQMAYLSMLAEIERHHQHYNRTAQLVEIGAASREEMEEANANYKIERAKLSAARQKLLLLGMTAKRIDELRESDQMSALIPVGSPVSGVILSRAVNPGEVVTMGKELFRVADLSTVWVIGQIYEKDFANVRVGTPAVIATPAFPSKTFSGRVSYVDPRVEPQTRTAQIRIEVGNPGEILKLGMFVDVNFDGAAPGEQAVVSVPRGAVQVIGAKRVVFVVTDKPGVFAQREVKAGAESNGFTPIYEGLEAGERVVTEGSFLLRAESLKLNPGQLTASATQSNTRLATQEALAKSSDAKAPSQTRMQSVIVTLNEKGFQPDSFKLRHGVPARVTFVRKAEATCGTEVVLADYNIKRELPFNRAVTVEFTPSKAGEFKFACGMDMLRGKIIVLQ